MIGYIGHEQSLDFYAGATFYVKDELVGFKTIGRLFHALKAGEVVGILMPYITGKDGLLEDGIARVAHHHFHIEREIVLDVTLSLVAKQPKIEHIKELIVTYDDYQACYQHIQQLSHVQKKTFVESRYDALQHVKTENQAAIVSNYQPHALDTLKTNLRDYAHNKHVFLLVGQTLKSLGFHNRVMLQVTFESTSRFKVYDVLHEAVMSNIKVSNISSIHKGSTEDQTLLLTLHEQLEHDNMIQLLTLLKQKAKHVQILGSYFSK
ncbi:MAG: prephenate dehydratase domain-containing protein [Candidatus Izemoplasma sp.]|nr:prephenate dehydratase domain-containing protein [Candidatus Izemoplasma sp.]